MGDYPDYLRKNMDKFLDEFALAGIYGAAGVIRSADPSSPVNGTFWFVLTGTSPNRTLSLRIRDAGVTQDIPLAAF